MRRMSAVLFLLAFLTLIFGSIVYVDSVGASEISFSFPFDCKTENGERTRCLADVFKTGLSTVLLGKMGICGARTAEAFTFDKDFEATRLWGTDECFVVKHDQRLFTKFRIAVVGADPAAVRLVSLKDDKSPVPQEMELKARKLAARHIEEPKDTSDQTGYPVTISDARPTVFRAENVTLLTFELQVTYDRREGPIPWEPGPTLVLMNGEVFLLEGACTCGEPIFFIANDKLYLTYVATVACCGCGDVNSFVYDLSSGTPKMVYQNSSFAN